MQRGSDPYCNLVVFSQLLQARRMLSLHSTSHASTTLHVSYILINTTFRKTIQLFFCAGIVRTALPNMDREARNQYLLVIQAKDMVGQMGGLSGTTSVTVMLTDVNDNPPHFSRSMILPPAIKQTWTQSSLMHAAFPFNLHASNLRFLMAQADLVL